MKRYVRKLELDRVRRASRSKSKSASKPSLDLSIEPLINSSLEVDPAPSIGSISADDPRYARMAAELKAIKDQLAAFKGKPSESEVRACESAVEMATDRSCHYPRSRSLPSSQDQGRRYVDDRKGVRGMYPRSGVASGSPVANSQAALDRHGKGVSDVMVSSPNPSPRGKWKYEASRPTKWRWNREQSRSHSPGSSSHEPCPSEDDLDSVPMKRTKSRAGSLDRAAEDPSPSTIVIRHPSPSEPQDPAEVAKSFMSVMQEQLLSLVQAFSHPHAQSDRHKDDSLPVKKSASKSERSSLPKEPLRASSKTRHRTASSSARRQDDSASRSRRQDDSASLSRLQDDASLLLQDDGSSRRQNDYSSHSRRQDSYASRSRCQDISASLSRRQDDPSLLLQDDTASRRQDDGSSWRKDASFSHRQDASSSRLKDSSSARRQDASDSRRQDDTYARRQDASGSQGQAACSPLLQDESYDFPISDSREPSSRTKDVVEVEQDLDDVSEDEDKPADAAGD
ncbi:micronuclear linker histone polyprotein-like [Palaemon carinicauda]|uniref:micronuclear linker histone polyprotein-like n=1 Tax=Palaemon carinicauda TaxID=392227 RepID=UPI0035B62372